MSTAVRPGTGETWEQIFKDYPNEGSMWTYINNVLEYYAMFGRFGWKGNPHEFSVNKWRIDDTCENCERPKEEHPVELELRQIVTCVMMSMFEDVMPDGDPLAIFEYVANNEVDENVKKFLIYGIRYYYNALIYNKNPQVGHFIGRGFDNNKKDADAFLKGR